MADIFENTTPLQDSLRGGAQVHAFRSGGGLRVVRVEKPLHGELIGYGEHPSADDAIRMASDDVANGQRVYNPTKPDPHYLTGSSEASGEVDAWLLGGNTFDVAHRDGLFRVELHGYQHLETPDAVLVAARAGDTVRWEDDRGYSLVTRPILFPNGEPGSSTSVESSPEGATPGDAWMWKAFRLGVSETLGGAFASAFTAKHQPEAPGEAE